MTALGERHERPTRESDESGTIAPRLLLLGLLLLGSACLVYCLDGELNADEGFYLLASRLVDTGLMPYRDFGYTQGPLLPYVNLLWLKLFGFSLLGQRFAEMAWVLLSLGVGVTLLKRRLGWHAALVFVLLLLASPGWLAIALKGKTYAFAGLSVLVGTAALTSRTNRELSWLVFTLSAALGVGSRLPLLPFFGLGWLWLLWKSESWRWRLGLALGTSGAALGIIWYFGNSAWENIKFWTLGFHMLSELKRPFLGRVGELFLLAPALMVGLVLSPLLLRHSLVRPPPGEPGEGNYRVALGALLVTLIATTLPRTGWGEYSAPLVPSIAFLLSLPLGKYVAHPQGKRWVSVATTIASLGIAWFRPPALHPNMTVSAAQAADVLRTYLPREYTVVTSMPEIPTASGHQVPLALAAGKFSLTESIDPERSARLHLVTPKMLAELIADPRTGAVVLCQDASWNFTWSNPDHRRLSEAGSRTIHGEVARRYTLAYQTPHYAVLLRSELMAAQEPQ